MNLVWAPQAVADLRELRAHIGKEAPATAKRTTERIIEAVERLIPGNPANGRPGRVPGTRELVLVGTPYVVPYRIRGGRIVVLRVLHGARRWPGAL